ncbi:DUF2804 family protein [Bdellovibrionota bacterium FG-2]
MAHSFKKIPSALSASFKSPHLGTFEGGFKEVPSFNGIRGFLSHKRWNYVWAANDQLLLTAAVIDGGYIGNAFVCVTDLERGKILVEKSYLGLPRLQSSVNAHPSRGASAEFVGLGHRLHIEWGEDRSGMELSFETQGVSAEVFWDATGAPPPITVVGELKKGLGVITQKTNLLKVSGSVKIKGRKRDFRGALGGLDFTSGHLPRHTRWNWLMASGELADGTAFGCNLAIGNNLGGQSENALWLGSDLVPVGLVRISQEKRAWGIKSIKPGIDLYFEGKAWRREDRELGLVSSHFAQGFGMLTGNVDGKELGSVRAVVEDQNLKW